MVTGCAPYRFGTASLYSPDIRTVYVPMITSGSYRRNLGERLTEAVVKEIELKTPYKVVSTPDADSILSAQLLSDSKRIVIEAPTDEMRLNALDFVVQVTWIDRQGNLVQPTQAIPVPTSLVAINQEVDVIPEVGQSIATGQQQAMHRLAEQIVGMMEAPW